MQGPLDILSNLWEGSSSSNESVVSHTLSMREKLSQMFKLVHKNLTNYNAQVNKSNGMISLQEVENF